MIQHALACLALAVLLTPTRTIYTDAEVLQAIRIVESGDREDVRDGDGGRAIGPYQIHRGYHVDALVRGAYACCRKTDYATGVVTAYMNRYAPGRLSAAMTLADAEAVARIHNGGPRGRTKSSTLGYWTKVRRVLSGGK